jgi:hypothetical protein
VLLFLVHSLHFTPADYGIFVAVGGAARLPAAALAESTDLPGRSDMISMGMIALPAMLVLILIVLALYWLPSILGYLRRHPDLVTVVVVNALLGWTVIGWIIALATALRPVAAPATAGPYLSDYGAAGRGTALDDL